MVMVSVERGELAVVLSEEETAAWRSRGQDAAAFRVWIKRPARAMTRMRKLGACEVYAHDGEPLQRATVRDGELGTFIDIERVILDMAKATVDSLFGPGRSWPSRETMVNWSATQDDVAALAQQIGRAPSADDVGRLCRAVRELLAR